MDEFAKLWREVQESGIYERKRDKEVYSCREFGVSGGREQERTVGE